MTSQVEPIISVVMSVYNSERFLRDAVKSVLDQTFRNLEFIMVDDASTDGSLAIMEDFAKTDARVKLICNQKNVGLTRSLIRAIGQAKGEYIARQDSDDISLPQRLEKQIEFLEGNPSYGAVGTFTKIIDNNGKIIKNAKLHASWMLIKIVLRFGNPFVHGSMMFRRNEYIEAGGYREFVTLGQDFDLWLRISKAGKMKNLKDALYLWRRTEGSITSKKEDVQYKIGALALFDFRYGMNLQFDKDIDAYIEGLSNKNKRKYFICLRDLCLWHGNIEMAEKYCADRDVINFLLINIARVFYKIVRFVRH